jgi:hypothetical protein
LALLGSSGCATEQGQADEAESVDVARAIPPGTSLVFSVDGLVSTATHARGDVFSATLRHHLTDEAGSEAIPEGVASQWIVAQAATARGETVLAARLESIRVSGTWMPVMGEVTEVHLRVANGASIAVGGAARELLGEGVSGGGGEGAVVALTTRGVSASIPAGSAITVKLTAPLEL